jgi:hypothetical protein
MAPVVQSGQSVALREVREVLIEKSIPPAAQILPEEEQKISAFERFRPKI